MIDLTDWKYAEAIYCFIQLPYIRDDFSERAELENLSMAEYVQRYKLEEFAEFYEKMRYQFERR